MPPIVITPTQNLSANQTGIPVGGVLNILDGILLVGAKDTPILSSVKRVPTDSIKSVWEIDEIRKARKSGDSAKKYVESLNNSASSTEQEIENVVQYFVDDIVVSNVSNALATNNNGHKTFDSKKGKTAIEHAKDLEASFWSDASPYLSKNDTEKNIVGGVWHYIPSTHEFDYRDGLGKPTKDLDADDLFDIQEAIWDRGGDPGKLYVSMKLKKKINKLIEAKKLYAVGGGSDDKIVLKTSVVETDAGRTEIIVSRYLSELGMHDRILCADLDFVEAGELIPTKYSPLSTTDTATAGRLETAMTWHFRNAYALSAGYGFKYQ